MAKYAGYTGNDINEYWKYHYGKPYDGSPLQRLDTMNDEDMEIGKVLVRNYDTKKMLTDNYGANTAATEDGYQKLIDNLGGVTGQRIADANANFDRDSNLLAERYGVQKKSAENLYKTNSENILSNYQVAMDTIEESKKQQEQMAGVTYEKLKKYLPQQVKAQGLSGLGVSESTMLEAYNTLMGQMGKIGANYGQNMISLQEAYGSDKRALDAEHERTMRELELAYGDNAAGLERERSREISAANADNTYWTNQYGLQKDRELFDLKTAYNTDIYNADKDPMGYYLVDDVQEKYRQKRETEENNAAEIVYQQVEDMLFDEKYFHDFGNKILTEDGKNAIAAYIEQNRDLMGEAYYKAEMSRLGTMEVYSKQKRNEDFESKMLQAKNTSDPNDKLMQYSEILSSIEGMKGSADYDSYKNRLRGGYTVDHSEFIGKMPKKTATMAMVKMGARKINAENEKVLNKLTNGNETNFPINGTTCLIGGDLFVYMNQGWFSVKADVASASGLFSV